MSGIAGVLHLDGRPVAAGDLAVMTSSMAHRGPDGINSWVDGSVGLGHLMLHTTPESLHELQPLQDGASEICLAFDGRIDNREELYWALGRERLRLRDDTDAELVLHCYRNWGKGAVIRLIGDFAFALWDARRRQLTCARDFLGKRPFYYSFNGRTFRFASEPQAVLADRSVPRVPNKELIAEYLTVDVRSTSATLFEHLFRLPPAHMAVLSADGLRLSRYWEWDPAKNLRLKVDQEYGERFLEVSASAVEDRLRSSSPVVVELSGGVDSSSLVGLVDHLRLTGRCDSMPSAYSLIFPGRPCDEAVHCRSVARQCGVVTRELEPLPTEAALYEAQAHLYLDLPNYPMTMMRREAYRALRDDGVRVVLTGKGPDEWLTGGPLIYAEQLRHFRIRQVVDEVRSGATAVGLRSALLEVWHFGLAPQVPFAIRRSLRRIRDEQDHHPWILKSLFDSGCGLAVRRPEGVSRSRWEAASHLDDGWHAHANEFGERANAFWGNEGRDPFDDRRVVELSLALPNDQRWKHHVSKRVLRQAVKGLIPESVRTRTEKGDYSHVICEDLLLQGGPALFQDMAMEDMGWVDGSRVRATYDQLEAQYRVGDASYHRNLWPIWMLLSLERWLRATL